MHPIFRAIEKVINKLIPYAIGGLLVLIVFELFVPHEDPRILLVIKIVDTSIISIFVMDLLFFAWRARSAKTFFREHWLDILAIFPFESFFKIVNRFSKIVTATEQIKITQALFHETLEVSKEAEHLTRASRGLRIGTRIIRVLSKSKTIRKIKRRLRT